ncbi:MAG: galactokinase family protein [bacterium]
MSEHESHATAQLFAKSEVALARLEDSSSQTEPLAFFVPGRIEVLGKHTDYAGGRSLLCAIDRGFAVLAQRRDDARIRIVDAVRGDARELALIESDHAQDGDWSAYVATVARRLARDFPSVRRGINLSFASNLPPASGMSSSSALVIASFLALHAANALGDDRLYQSVIRSREELAEYLGAVENGRVFGPLAGDRGVGTLGGSQDQTAILCCRSEVLSRYAFCPVRAEGEVAFPATHAFVVAYSGVAAEKTAAAKLRYNEASLATVRILEHWNRASNSSFTSIGDAVAAAHDAADQIRAVLRESHSEEFTSQRLLDRFDQFVVESFEIIPRAASALASGDLQAFGTLVDLSHRNAETLLGNQIPETMALQRSARALGADAASAFGAGFGGSVWAMTTRAEAERFATEWSASYRREFPTAAARSEFIVAVPGQGAVQL